MKLVFFVPLAAFPLAICLAQQPGQKNTLLQMRETAPVITSEANAAAPPRVDEAIAKSLNVFFGLLAKNQIDKAYEHLILGTKIAEQSKDVATLRTKTQQAIQMFGEVRGHELVGVKNVGTHLLAATYLSVGRDFPLRWRFYFYRADGPWKLVDIRVDDRLMDMFDEKTPVKSAEPLSEK